MVFKFPSWCDNEYLITKSLFMSTQKTKGKQEPTSHTTGNANKGQESEPTHEQKKAFDEGLQNNSNTQTGTANSGYDEKNPKKAGGTQQSNPKVTNQDNDITNTEKGKQWNDEPVDEQSTGKTEKKIPNMKATDK